jgi:hypothetical protein
MSQIFHNGNGVIVNARGAGRLHVLHYAAVPSTRLANIIGYIETTASDIDITRFVISFSHYYTRIAFYWEGEGEASFGTAKSLVRTPMATSWEKATVVEWLGNGFSTSFTSANVKEAAQAPTTVVRNGIITATIIPDL